MLIYFTIILFDRRQFGSEISPGVYDITTSQQSLVVSILSVGTFFGSLIGE